MRDGYNEQAGKPMNIEILNEKEAVAEFPLHYSAGKDFQGEGNLSEESIRKSYSMYKVADVFLKRDVQKTEKQLMDEVGMSETEATRLVTTKMTEAYLNTVNDFGLRIYDADHIISYMGEFDEQRVEAVTILDRYQERVTNSMDQVMGTVNEALPENMRAFLDQQVDILNRNTEKLRASTDELNKNTQVLIENTRILKENTDELEQTVNSIDL